MTTQIQTAAAASSNKDIAREESEDWRQLSFLRVENGEIVEYWAPAEVKGVSEDNAYIAECSLGGHYALEVIGHMRRYADRFDGDYLLPVIASIVERGKWSGVEIGFFAALSQYITWGRACAPHPRARRPASRSCRFAGMRPSQTRRWRDRYLCWRRRC